MGESEVEVMMSSLTAIVLAFMPIMALSAVSFPAFDPDGTHQGLPMDNWDITPKQWKFFGDAKAGTHTGSAIMTEENVKHQGRVWSRKAFTQTSWVIQFAFKMHGDGEGSGIGNEGLAFWITEEREKAGPLFGSAMNFSGVGIFFDTYDNDEKNDNPIIMGVQNNGQKQLSAETDFKRDRFGGCRAKYRNRNSMVRVKLKYSANADGVGHLQLWLSMLDQGHFDVCFARDNVKLRCGTDPKVKCRLGFSTANRPSAKAGDAVTVADLKIWDIGALEAEEVKKDIAAKDMLRKRNEMNTETQEMLENVETHTQKVGDALMEKLHEEVRRDRQSKKREFEDLHGQLNSTLNSKGPINKRDVKALLQDVQELTKLAAISTSLLKEVRKGRKDEATTTAEKNSRDLMDTVFNGRQDLRVLHHQARTAQNAVTKELRDAANDAESKSWVPYVLFVQAVIASGLVFYKKKQAAAITKSQHMV